jgi:hypothetical protein
MKKSTYEFRSPTYNQLSLLDGNTRLRMAERNESQSTLVHASAPAATFESPKASTTKEAIAATLLMLGFTALFWMLLGYIRSH